MSKKNIQLSFFVAFTVILAVLLFFILRPYIGVVFVAAIFAVSFYPIYEKFLAKLKGRKSLASFFTTFLILIFVIVPIVVMSALLLKEAVQLYNSIAFDQSSQGFISEAENLANKLNSFFPAGVIDSPIDLGGYARNILNWIIGHFDSIFVAVFGGIFNFIMMLISLYYLFIYGERIKKSLIMWSPLPDGHDEEFVRTLRSSIDAVLRGRILVSVAQGAFIGIGFYIFGVGSPILWGFVGGIASLVPILGTSVVTVPAVAYLFLSDSVPAGIGLLLWAAVAVGLVDNVISIIFLKGKIKVHPLVILFSILGGVEVFGAIGFLVGPVVVSAIVALLQIYPFIMSSKNQSEINDKV